MHPPKSTGLTRGQPMDRHGSPGARATGVSVAALSSPARTGRAMLAVHAPNSSPPSPPPGFSLTKIKKAESNKRSLFLNALDAHHHDILPPPFCGARARL